MDSTLNELISYIQSHKVISTHSHHLEDTSFHNFNLDKLLTQTYVNWCGVPLGKTYEERTDYLNKVRYKSYFVWLQKSLQELYTFDEPITADNWELISNRIEEAHKDDKYHIDVLQQRCNYHKVVLDTYWKPGSNNGRPELFTPTFRVDPFFYGYGEDIRDHDGNSPKDLYGIVAEDIDEYIAFIRELIITKKKQGCVAIKSAIAYDRDLNFMDVSKIKASLVLKSGKLDRTDQDIRAFQDYLFHRVCEIAAELDLPLQCHTGMGQLTGTRAMALKDTIEKHPDTKFVLFHCSFPWMDDINALLHACRNVYPDLCWLPILSPTAAQRMLHELIEVGTSDKVCWGCDTWTSEESYGAWMAMKFVLANVLESKIKEGYFSIKDAKKMIDNILYDNAANLYGLK